MKRVITHEEERVIRLCHHDHEGLSVEDAAIRMDVTVKDIKRFLRSAKRKAPQMFPILTPQHDIILMMYGQYKSRKSIAVALGITLPMLKRQVRLLRKHGFLRDRTMKRYESNMDSQVAEKF